jgi:hypothetical protein
MATAEQLAARDDPKTKEAEAAFAHLLAEGKVEIMGEKWSERTGRVLPIYGLTAKGAKGYGMSPTKLDGARREFNTEASSEAGLTEADIAYRKAEAT